MTEQYQESFQCESNAYLCQKHCQHLIRTSSHSSIKNHLSVEITLLINGSALNFIVYRHVDNGKVLHFLLYRKSGNINCVNN